MLCTKCGEQLADDAGSCIRCGTPIIRVRQGPSIGWTPPDREALPLRFPQPASESPEIPETPGTIGAPRPKLLRYAGFWLRALAYLVDSFLILLLAMPSLVLFAPRDSTVLENYSKLPPDQLFNLTDPEVRPVMLVVLPLMLLCGWLYYALFESSSWQATPGKKLLGLYVTDLSGRSLSFTGASARFFCKIITGLVPFGIGWILAGFTARKQALHDMIARCLVLRRVTQTPN